MLSIVLIALASAPARACPHGAVCVAAETRAATATELPARLREDHVPSLRGVGPEAKSDHERLWEPLRFSRHGRALDPLERALRVDVAPEPPDIEMPWIWRVLRREVYERLPTYEEPRFTLTLSPVVVSGPADTIPGVGVEGVF